MTRFQKEISGQLGEYWKKDAEKRAQDYVTQANNEAVVDDAGAIRWKSNGSYLMDDFCEVLEYAGYPFSREATRVKRVTQVKAELEEYRKNPPVIDVAELRAAFGDGVTVVDVISGSTIHL